jgi:MFS family permease
MAALSSALCYFTYSFMEPILAERLAEFDLNSMQIGLFFAIWPVFYIPASITVQYFPRRIDKRVTIIISAFFIGIAFIFVGPSKMLGFPNSLMLMGIGQALVGVFTAFMMIPGLPEMVESTIPLYPGQERRVNNLSAGIYNSFLGFGQVIAPAYGAFFTEAIGFRWTADIVAIICFVFGGAYFALAGGPNAFSRTCKAPDVNSSDLKTMDDDFRQLAGSSPDDDTVSRRSGRSRLSSFHMLGPTSTAVIGMRVRDTSDYFSPPNFGEGETSPRPRGKGRMHRLNSAIDNDGETLTLV